SVKDAQAMRRVAGIVARETARSGAPIVVVSAMSGVTDQLLSAVASADAGDAESAVAHIWTIRDRHRAAVDALLPVEEGDAVLDALEQGWRETAAVLQAMAVLREVSPKSRDAVVAMGEIASSRLVAAALPHLGVPAAWVDVRSVLVTDDSHGAAMPDLPLTSQRLRELVVPHIAGGATVVLGGFVGATRGGATTTLGRGGSDYSASLFGAGVRASAIQI